MKWSGRGPERYGVKPAKWVVTPPLARGPLCMVIADLYECASPCDPCGVRLFRPGIPRDDREPPTCGCGRPMRPAGHLIW